MTSQQLYDSQNKGDQSLIYLSQEPSAFEVNEKKNEINFEVDS